MGLLAFVVVLAVIYLFLQLHYIYHWRRTPPVKVPPDFNPINAVSVIVVVRNEEKSIEKCIRGILNQNYPTGLFEIIVIIDRSTDKTVEKIEQINSSQLRIFNLQDYPEFIHLPAYKKSGVELGVHHAKNEWIMVSDADCAHPVDWLRTFAFMQESSDAVFLTGPIQLEEDKMLLVKMQQMENLTLMVITAAGIQSGLHDIANGANMSFSRTAFLEAGGYEGNYQYASGDDMFLIEKMRKLYPDKIRFVKSLNASVISSAKKDWTSLIRQRIRWAGKNKGLKSPVISIIWGFVGIYHLGLMASALTPVFFKISWWPFLILLITKWIADFSVLIQASTFFGKHRVLTFFIPLQFFYLFYVVRVGWNIVLGRKGDWEKERNEIMRV